MLKKFRYTRKQCGITLFGLIIWLVILGFIDIVVAKVAPTTTEYLSIKKALASARTSGATMQAIQNEFNKRAEVGYIDAISGKDLGIAKNGDDIQINFSYEKKISLTGPVSLLINYAGNTAKSS